MEKLPTIKEIAKRLHVSASTVSRALHNHPSIGLVTTMRVHKIATELNYSPNLTAISFKQKRTFTIGVVLPHLSEAFFSAAISGIEEYASAKNYNVLIGQSLDNVEREIKIVEAMKTHRVDGMIVSISKDTSSYDHFENLKLFKIPIVFFDRIPNLPRISYTACNLKTGMIDAIDHLIRAGHQRIALINGPATLQSSIERLEIYKRGLGENGIKSRPYFEVSTNLSTCSNHACIKGLMALDQPPTAVITFNDYVALDAIKFLKDSAQVNTVSFVSFANMPIWNYMDHPPVASIEQFPYRQGEKAAEILFDIMQHEDSTAAEPVKYLFDSVLMHHESDAISITKR